MTLINPQRRMIYNDFHINADKAIELLNLQTVGNPGTLFFSRITKAIGRVIIDHAGRLHKGVTNGTADKLESILF